MTLLIALDGEVMERPLLMNTVDIAPGQTVDLDFVANNPGVWLFHCHEMHNAIQGMPQAAGRDQMMGDLEAMRKQMEQMVGQLGPMEKALEGAH